MKLLNARQKMVTLAVASALAGGAGLVSVPAHAINISQNNLGQVLLYPYYTTRNGYDTLVSVVNTSNRTVAFKIRFREALNSRETRDFNVILSPYDVWNGSVTADGAGGALFRTFDKTCTSPNLPASTTAPGATEIAFTNAAYSGTSVNPNDDAWPFHHDGGGTSIDRVREGYIEVISMFASSLSTDASSNVVEYNAKHVNGAPRNCAKVDEMLGTETAVEDTLEAWGSNWLAPENVLKGHSTFIDVAGGKAIDAEPTAIEDWVLSDGPGGWNDAVVPGADNVYAGGDLAPDLGNGTGENVLKWLDDGRVGNYSTSGLMGGVQTVDNVSALLMADEVLNQYATGSGVLTDWVVTFPTKHHYVDQREADSAAVTPFTESFDYDTSNGDPMVSPYSPRGRSCDPVTLKHWDREEKTSQSGSQFSPITPTSNSLCYEANVITFNGSYLFGNSTIVNHKNVDTTASGTSGWSRLTFGNERMLVNSNNAGEQSFVGLPVIGFAATVRNNASEVGNNRNYASSEVHAYRGGKDTTPDEAPDVYVIQ